MSSEVIGLKGVKIPDLQETTEVRDSNYMILVDEVTGRTYKVKREHIKAQKTSELVDDVGFLRAIPGEYMTESEVKEFTNAEIAQIREVLNTWTSFKNSGGHINGDINVNNANLNGSLNFSGVLNNTDLKTENKKIFDIKRDTGDQIYFGNNSLKMVLDAKEFNAYGIFNCHSGINIPNNSISQTGYTKLPNGLILQWGYVTISQDTGHAGVEGFEVAINFPISFPTMPLSISCVPGTNHHDVSKITKHLFRYDTLSKNGVSTYVYAESAGAWHAKMFYMAIGY